MPYCISNVIICDKATRQPVTVLDAKNKFHNISSRDDSHQLLAYVLLTGVDKCSFVFSRTNTALKTLRSQELLELNAPLLRRLSYYKLILGNTVNVN